MGTHTHHFGEGRDVCIVKAAIVLQKLVGSGNGLTAAPLFPAGRLSRGLTPQTMFQVLAKPWDPREHCVPPRASHGPLL